MSPTSNVFRALVSLLLVVCFCIGGFADTIRLKDGSKVKGKIVSFSGGKFIVAVGEGSRRREMTLQAGDVDSIESDTPRSPAPTVLASNRNTTSSVPPEDKRVADNKSVSQPVEEEEDVVKVPSSTPSNTPKTTPATKPNPNKKVSYAKSVELSIKVLADNTANGWTNSGWIVK